MRAVAEPGAARAPDAAGPGRRGIVLGPAELRVGPSPESARTGERLDDGQIVTVVARSTDLPPGVEDGDLGWPRFLVRGEGEAGAGWVSGEWLAVEQRWGDVGWPGEWLTLRAAGAPEVWSALQVGREWSANAADWWRDVAQGWAVVDLGGLAGRTPLVDSNGWGSEHRIEAAVPRELTGDGIQDWLLVISESVTEAGHAGRGLALFDPSHGSDAVRGSIPVHDPHWNGLATEERWGYVDVFLAERRVRRTNVVLVPCPEPDSGGAAPVCLARAEAWWSIGTEGLVAEPEVLSPLRAAVGEAADAPLDAPPYDAPEGPLLGPEALPEVCVQRARGPLGTGDAFWALVGPCGGAPLAWVDSRRLRFDDPLIAEVIGPWPDEANDCVRWDWERAGPAE